MRSISIFVLGLLLAASFSMPGWAETPSHGGLVPTSSVAAKATAPARLRTARAVERACDACRLLDLEREPIVDDIVHYRATVQVGPGELDRIGLHRVVRERAPWRPARQREAVFLAHGINVGFEGTFMPGVGVEGADPGNNMPVFLARHDVDVWGISFRFTLVPGDTPDIGFMADWGLELEASDLRVGLGAARLIRQVTASGFGKLDLLGYSRGVRISYTYLNDETERPPGLRHVARFIALDGGFKTDSEATRELACSLIDGVQADIDAGEVADDIRFLGVAGGLALTAPEAPSPVLPGLSNRQAALVIAALPPGGTGTFHGFAGVFEDGAPVTLRFTEEPAALDLLASAASYQPAAGFRDLLIVFCDDGRSEIDDHLFDITVPVLYIGAAGGNQDFGLATFPFLGSTELASILLAVEPAGRELFDIGHGDILAMRDGAALVWQPALDWITTR